MTENAMLPEERFLRAVFADDYSDQRLAILFSGDDELIEELQSRIDTALDTLSYRERGILKMRYGMGDGYTYTLAQAGYVFKLTRERIRQLQARSLRRLRSRAVGLRQLLEGLEI